ncbi:MAG: DNA-3-methyladenine glycosylase 2 family protein [Candidatus Dormibacteraeota bacterium]|nr:DNA-3-methyladenine glycosylase 2 family protein [Candidatus Dormibacteraeota bacterium]
MTVEVEPRGPFDLENQNQYFGGWPVIDGAVTMAFPVEGWHTSAAVALRQAGSRVTGEIFGARGRDAEKAWHQALAAISLDFDGEGFADVGRRDPAVGELQQSYKHLRPSLFHSPYEAAAGFTIGHRIQISQARRIRHQLAETHGEGVDVGGTTVHAFPRPQQLLKLKDFTGLSSVKVDRLHAIARAALDGWLDRDALRALAPADALEQLQALPGVGPFFSQGILMRGAGLADAFTDDDLTVRAVKALCKLPDSAGLPEVLERAEAWRPYRMWCVVLLHVWYRGQPGVAEGLRGGGRAAAQKAGRARPRG